MPADRSQEKPTQNRRALRVNDYCAAYSVSRATAYKMMAEGKLRTVKIGGRRLIPVDVAEELLQGGNNDRP